MTLQSAPDGGVVRCPGAGILQIRQEVVEFLRHAAVEQINDIISWVIDDPSSMEGLPTFDAGGTVPAMPLPGYAKRRVNARPRSRQPIDHEALSLQWGQHLRL